MKLTKIQVHGYRRLVDASCFVSGKLTVFVGPNEAGKSSLLAALATVNEPDEVAQRDRPRGRQAAEDDAYIELTFRLDGSDLDAVAHVASVGAPLSFNFHVRNDGTLRYRTVPRLRRPTEMLERARVTAARYAGTRGARELERTDDADGAGNLLDLVLRLLDSDSQLDEDQRHVVESLIDSLPHTGLAGRAGSALQRWLDEQALEDPHAASSRILYDRRPVFALFGDAERALASDYHLPDVADDAPAALGNLAQLALLNLSKLYRAVQQQDVGAVETLTERANARLREVFESAWSQQPVHVRLKQDVWTLRVLVSTEEGGYSSIAERSDGLKTFVALSAFAARHIVTDRPLILMIDEAEQHLHYDAQADIVRMLDRQTVAQQVIYTTHSAGCLPPDMGTGIRPVLPAGGSGHSRISNNFWESGPGFTPLLMAMGAAATAITPARYAVLAEGATDMMLLPTLVREATGRERLDYQVAPGIAGSTLEQLSDLNLEAARVVYLVDGDAGGAAHLRNLKAANVPDSNIVSLGGAGSGLCLEDLLRVEPLIAAVNEALLRRHGQPHTMKITDLSSPHSRYSAIKAWSKQQGLDAPSKTAIVAALLEQQSDRLLSGDGRRHVKRVHAAICTALHIPK